MTQIALKTGWYMCMAGFLAGASGASYISCKLTTAKYLPSNRMPAYPVTMPNAIPAPIAGPPKPVYVKGETVFRDTGRVEIAHDSITQVITEHTVDTLMLPYSTGVVHDTTFLTRQFDLIAAFQSRGHLIEVRAGTEHDFAFGGYGGQVSLQLNLDKIHLANVQPFVEVGYLHAPHVSVGIAGTIGGVW